MNHRYILAVIMLIATTMAASAGTTGILTGKVTDNEGNPVLGVTIRVLGTTRGGVTKVDGKYTVSNITSGTHDLRITALGFDTVLHRVSIVADQTLTQNFSMKLKAYHVDSAPDADPKQEPSEREFVLSTDVQGCVIRERREPTVRGISDSAEAFFSFIAPSCWHPNPQIRVDGLVVTDTFTGGLGGTNATTQGAMSNDVRMMPNPATDHAILRISSPTSGLINVQLVSMLGETVMTTASPAALTEWECRLDVRDLRFGTYQCIIEQGGVRTTVPLVVLR
jgi:hypothetical protein